MSKFISVLLPTRKRVNLLKESIDSLWQNASDPSQIEVLLAIDNDDQDTIIFAASYSCPLTIRGIVTQRCGYELLHLYVNALCNAAQGELLMLWNDNSKMLSKNWDVIVKDLYSTEKVKMVCYQLQNNHYPNIFPVVSKSIIDIMGHFSLNPHSDTWIELVCYDFQREIPVNVWYTTPEPEPESINAIKTTSQDFYSDLNAQLRGVDKQLVADARRKADIDTI
jgi:glycosyltransferase involved in cell wall biosynthesis